MAETGNCTTGGITQNNCFGIMTWERGFRELKSYSSIEESYDDFKRIWTENYQDYPSWNLAHTWTGGDSTDTWLYNVNYYY